MDSGHRGKHDRPLSRLTMEKKTFKSVDDYIASQPPAARAALEQVRAAIRKALPEAAEDISYNMPAYKLHDSVVLYFAGWKEHYSLYRVNSRVVAAFREELDRYRLEKGTVHFPYSEPVPVDLIERIAKYRAALTVPRMR